MTVDKPFRFEFIRRRYPHLLEDEIQAAEARFARFLDILAEVAMEHAAKEIEGNNRFDKTERVPQNPTQSAPEV